MVTFEKIDGLLKTQFYQTAAKKMTHTFKAKKV